MNNFTDIQKNKLIHQVWMLVNDRDTRAHFNKYWNLHLTKKYVKDLMNERFDYDSPDYKASYVMTSYVVLCELFGKSAIDEWLTDTADDAEKDFRAYDWHNGYKKRNRWW